MHELSPYRIPGSNPDVARSIFNNFQRYKFENAGIDTSFFDDAKERLRTCENIEQSCEVLLEAFETLCDQQPEKFGDAYALTFGILFLNQKETTQSYNLKIQHRMHITVEKVIAQEPWKNNADHNTLKQMVQLQNASYPEIATLIKMFVVAAREAGLDEVGFSVPLLTLTSRK